MNDVLLAIPVSAVVSAALVAGTAWGSTAPSPPSWGFIIALAGGALIVSSVLDSSIPPPTSAPLRAVAACVLAGAGVFVGLDRVVNQRLGSDNGGGLLAAITLDGIPENLALGVALIGAGPLKVGSLSGSILLSNLPEAAGAHRRWPRERSNAKVLGLWTGTALLLSVAALAARPPRRRLAACSVTVTGSVPRGSGLDQAAEVVAAGAASAFSRGAPRTASTGPRTSSAL